MNDLIARASILVLLFAGCSATETGNPPFQSDVGFDDRMPMGISPDPVVDEAWLAIEGLAFVPDGDCGTPPNPEALPPVALELVDGGQAITVEVEEGLHCGLVVAVAPGVAAPPIGAPSEIGEVGLVVLGTARGGMPVKAALTTHERYTVATSAPFSMTPAEPPVLLGIDLTLLFAGVRLAGLEVTDGVIVIDGDHNAEAFATLVGQLPGAFVLARDADRDGVIDETELLPR